MIFGRLHAVAVIDLERREVVDVIEAAIDCGIQKVVALSAPTRICWSSSAGCWSKP